MIPTGKRVSQVKSLPAPTGGLNARDNIADMKETDALTLENWFATPSSVDIRNGYASHVTGLPDAVETLCAYSFAATKKLFAASGTAIYDVTSAGAVGAAVVSGMTNARWQHINFGNAAGNFLMMVNGADKLRRYNGTSWSADGDGSADITGFDTATAIHINNFKNRLFFIEENSMSFWYLSIAAIGGAATEFDLSGLFKLGGYLVAMANWTVDNSAGIDDYAVFITSEGECAVYQGINPSLSTDWLLKGTFRMGKPIGRRCFTKAASDVLLLTTDGAFPLSKALLTDRVQKSLAATDKISTVFNADILSYGANFGWQPIIYPEGQKIIINVPTTENTEAHQYVAHTANGSWSKFTGWNANCFEIIDGELYFGGDTVVYQADTGEDDDGDNIQTVAQQAFSYFGTKAQKKFQMVRPIFISNGDVNPAVLMNVDFERDRTTTPPSFVANASAVWDVAPWDTSDWTSGDTIIKRWQSVTGVGFTGGVRVVTQTQNLTCKWASTDVLFEEGGVL